MSKKAKLNNSSLKKITFRDFHEIISDKDCLYSQDGVDVISSIVRTKLGIEDISNLILQYLPSFYIEYDQQKYNIC